MKNTWNGSRKRINSNSLPFASIIIAAHNNAKTLKKVIKSMLALNYQNYEIIIVDDGSTDDTEETVKLFLDSKKINYFRFSKNVGVCKARNKGIELAKYNIVVNMDHDCIPQKNWLKLLVEGFDSKKVGIVSSYAHYGGTSTAFRKNLLEKVGGYDEDYGYYREDTDLSFKIMELGYEFKLVKADFLHDHTEAMPQGLTGMAKYVLKRLKYHQNDVLLYKKHPTKTCREFLHIKYGFLIDPYKDFSVATGLWQGKFNLSSPRGLVFLNANAWWKKAIIIIAGITYVFLVKSSRLIGSIKHRKLLL